MCCKACFLGRFFVCFLTAALIRHRSALRKQALTHVVAADFKLKIIFFIAICCLTHVRYMIQLLSKLMVSQKAEGEKNSGEIPFFRPPVSLRELYWKAYGGIWRGGGREGEKVRGEKTIGQGVSRPLLPSERAASNPGIPGLLFASQWIWSATLITLVYACLLWMCV